MSLFFKESHNRHILTLSKFILSTSNFHLYKSFLFRYNFNRHIYNSSLLKMTDDRAVEDVYQKKTQLEHILLRPDTYIGSAEPQTTQLWVFEGNKFVFKNITYTPGLYKIFDEILVNAADNKTRDSTMDSIKVTIKPEENEISVWNNGKGIPVQMHKKENCYVPELIFGHLLTSSNYNDNEQKMTGGRNGFGAKLCNIFSTEFIVETNDKESGNKFTQTYNDNMSRMSKPKLTKALKSDYTSITFKPDLSKFGMDHLDEGIVSLMKKRVYDLAGILPGVKVFLNGERIPIRNFKDYVRLYIASAQLNDQPSTDKLKDNDTNSAKGEVNDENASTKTETEDKSTVKIDFDDKSSIADSKAPSELYPIFNPLANSTSSSSLSSLASTVKDDNASSYSTNLSETSKMKKESTINDLLDPKITVIYEKLNEFWEVAFAVSDGQFQQVSFVNSICTSKGGTHVDVITNQIASKIQEAMKKKAKDVDVKPQQIKSQIWVFINCKIVNPSFDSQTKENMTLKASKFGTKYDLQPTFLRKVINSGITENIMAFARAKQSLQLKKTDGTKRSRLSGIAKLDDANNAGTKNAEKCTLILTEGDSAKALAISGLGVVGRDNYGVFPLRGKLLNVRDASHKQIMDNAELQNIKRILGLQQGKDYETTDGLRYGHVMIMADQDHDGSHIKGLILNLFDHFWPSLLRIPGFVYQFITPIIRVTKGNQDISFYNMPEYEKWRLENNDGRGWTIKYYKGLGTSTSKDAKKYFGEMDYNRKPFAKANHDSRMKLELAFSKKKADDRKEWLSHLTRDTFMDHTVNEVSIETFVDKELILFSMADNVRSIPSLVDGFKPGQRKIMFSCFKRNLVKGEIKVAQLAGYVSEHSAYHHGEASLQSTIIGLAQDFVGSNNINLLDPRGQFGTRIQGGKDSAHARYIFTRLTPLARACFPQADEPLLNYLNEENMDIEPEYYVPVIPLLLVNGAEGIGTGWSTSIPNYNPIDLINNIRRKLDGFEFESMDPWYKGFNGTVAAEPDKYRFSGIITKVNDTTLEITELPLQTWTQNYKEFLESLVTGNEKTKSFIKEYKEYHTDTTVHFIVSISAENMSVAETEGLDKKFKISTTKSTSNMVLFDSDGQLKRYSSSIEILEEFFPVRLEYYDKRKSYLVAKLDSEFKKLSNQARFILEVNTNLVKVHNIPTKDICRQLEQRGYEFFSKNKFEEKFRNQNTVIGENDPEDDDDLDLSLSSHEKELEHNYRYLLDMPLRSLTYEKAKKLNKERDEKKKELDILASTTISDLWRRDLDVVEREWNRKIDDEAKLLKIAIEENSKKRKLASGSKKSKSDKKRKLKKEEEEEEEWEG